MGAQAHFLVQQRKSRPLSNQLSEMARLLPVTFVLVALASWGAGLAWIGGVAMPSSAPQHRVLATQRRARGGEVDAKPKKKPMPVAAGKPVSQLLKEAWRLTQANVNNVVAQTVERASPPSTKKQIIEAVEEAPTPSIEEVIETVEAYEELRTLQIGEVKDATSQVVEKVPAHATEDPVKMPPAQKQIAKIKPSKAVNGNVKRRPTGGKVAKEGIFSPLVEAARFIMGESELTKWRGEAIQAHTAVISAFANSLSSKNPEIPDLGVVTLQHMFKLADTDRSGQLDREEVRAAMQSLGFTWMDDDKKIDKLLDKMDQDGNELIDFEEFVQQAPGALRQNLVKLAKKNGNELGFLV